MSKQVAKQEGNGLPPALLDEMKNDAGKGVSTAAEDSLVPLIYVLQTNSPQVNKRNPAYIEGAEPGDIWLRNAPHPIIKGNEGLLVQPCYFYKDVGEWIPRDNGGGFVGRHANIPADAKKVDDPENPNRIRWVSPTGNDLVEARNHVVIAYTDEGPLPYLISFTSTGHSVSRTWTFLMKSKRIDDETLAPSWACLYRLKTQLRKNKAGEWFVLQPEDEKTNNGGPCWVNKNQYTAGRKLNLDFAAGVKKVEEPLEPELDLGGERESDII